MNYERLYQFRHRDTDQAHRQLVWNEIAVFVHDALGKPSCVLDPAAGLGEFINAVPAAERWAVDQHAYEQGTYDAGVKAVVSNVFDADLPPAHFDGIFVSNFLEHLASPDEVARFLEAMAEHTAPGGRIAVMGPNFRYCKNAYFDMADHTTILTHRAIVEHLYAAGFTPERVEPQFLPYSFSGRNPTAPVLVRAYLRFPPAWRIMGKQFLVIARR